MKKATNHIGLIILLAVLSSVAPISTDTYIPAIPDIAKDFSVNIEKIELTLSIFLIGFSIGQIFGGAMSDRIGRRKSSLIGLLGFALFSVLIIFSSSIYELWVYRFIEAFFGGTVVINATAVVRDKFHGQESAKIFALIGTIGGLAPLFAPALGSFIIHFLPWKAVFGFLTIYALLVAFFVYKDLDETFTYSKQKILESYKAVLTHKRAMKVMLTLAFGFSGFFIFIAKASYIFIEHYKISSDYFPFYFGLNFVFLIIMIKVNLQLLKTFKAKTLIKSGIFIQMIMGIIWILTYKDQNLYITMVLMVIYMSMMAFVFGNGMSMALEHFKTNTGVASGVIGVLEFGIASIVSSIALLFQSQPFLTIGISITIASTISFLMIRTYK